MYYNTTYKTKVINGSKLHYVFIKNISFLSIFFPFFKNSINNFLRTRRKKSMIIKNDLGKFLVHTNDDTIGKSSPYFEFYLQRYVSKLKGNNIFLDIGANIGFYSFLALKKRGFKKSYCFEANPDTFKVLKKNVSLNGCDDKIILNNIALGSKKSKLNFAKNKFHTGGSRVIDINNYKSSKDEKIISVEQVKLDSYVRDNKLNVSKISFIKIDVEGHEYEVLKGMSNTLKNVSKGTRIFIEIWGKNKYRKDSLDLLDFYGFRIKESLGDNYLFIKE